MKLLTAFFYLLRESSSQRRIAKWLYGASLGDSKLCLNFSSFPEAKEAVIGN